MSYIFPNFQKPDFQFENAPTIQKMKFGFHQSEKIIFTGSNKQIKCWVCDPEFIFIRPKLQLNLNEQSGGLITVHIYPPDSNIKYSELGLIAHPKTDISGKIKVGPVEIGGEYQPSNENKNILQNEFKTDKSILKIEYTGVSNKSYSCGYVHYYSIKKKLADYILKKYDQISIELFNRDFQLELDQYANQNIEELKKKDT